MFHVKGDGPESELPLLVSIELENAVFDTEPDATHDPLFHSTNESPKPVNVSFPVATRAQVAWNGSALAGDAGWGRWIVRLRIRDSLGKYFPIHLGFTCLKKAKISTLRNQLLMTSVTSRAISAAASTTTEDALKLRTRIDLKGGEPLFPELFKPREEIGLPDQVYLEPLIVIKRTGVGKLLDFEFTSDDPIFLRCDPSDCNPGIPGKDPLALAWMGVTNAKAECEPTDGPVARAFVTSWIDQQDQVAAVRWREETVGDDLQRIASFFFVKGSASGDPTRTSGLVSLGTLIDPTIVYDKDDPPA